jgi:mannose-6-phosphate isomerase-like protein (cupin superfamily)
MAEPTAPFAVQADEGTTLRTPTRSRVIEKVHTRESNGSMTVLEFWVPPNDGPALHTHLREDELWYVVEGEFRFKAGDAMLHASTGGLAFGPRGLAHAFQNVGDEPGRLLVVTTPSGLERFFQQFTDQFPDTGGPVERELFAAVAEANWMEFVGPPLSVSDPW